VHTGIQCLPTYLRLLELAARRPGAPHPLAAREVDEVERAKEDRVGAWREKREWGDDDGLIGSTMRWTVCTAGLESGAMISLVRRCDGLSVLQAWRVERCSHWFDDAMDCLYCRAGEWSDDLIGRQDGLYEYCRPGEWSDDLIGSTMR